VLLLDDVISPDDEDPPALLDPLELPALLELLGAPPLPPVPEVTKVGVCEQAQSAAKTASDGSKRRASTPPRYACARPR
jgi:hypothetical protein